ncbi:MAG: gamma-glutamyl-gamma-aminobutyrate hydrolase family protein, partial [Chloroflexota bacterium]|nr:gamma-glutamyl-gamma-aminobutyrate hydrolase family protein [Chloroflexota bacterium]
MATKRPIIGITTYGPNEENHYFMPAPYVKAVAAAGGLPILLPPSEAEAEAVLALVDGFIFAGGGDIDPEEYGGTAHPALSPIDKERDRFELTLARLLLEQDTPTLGICRGAQVLAVASGGDLIVDLPEEVGNVVVHKAPPNLTEHPVTLEPDSRLAELLGTTDLPVPSWHHQAPRDVPAGWCLAARAPDGIIEAM